METPSPYQHIVHSRQCDKSFLTSLFSLTDEIRKNPSLFSQELRGKVAATLFYEPSTRTRMSFESAVMRLGGSVISTENAGAFSSAAKGETIEDTMRMLSHYAEFIIMRHYDDDAFEHALNAVEVPFINAGSGRAEHPTQSLLDLYTIHRELGRENDIHVVIVGDLKNGRTVRSLACLLRHYHNIHITFVSPPPLRITDTLRSYLVEHHVAFTETADFEEPLRKADVVYQTRVQKERFDDPTEYQRHKGCYVITRDCAQHMPKDSIIMHPLPRVDEITPDVDDDPRCRYFIQARNGMWVRMALLTVLNRHNYGHA